MNKKRLKEILDQVNNELKHHNLSLENDSVINEFINVEKCWTNRRDIFKKPLKFLIVGEATVSWDNYFYNPESKTTAFLNPYDFGCKTKEELIDVFDRNGILVFDLYPLPLSTFIYDNIKFNCQDDSYSTAMKEYFKEKLTGLIDNQTKIVLRYSKLYSKKKKRCEWTLFMNSIDRKNPKYDYGIFSKGMAADPDKIKEVFKGVIKKKLEP
jgi:hypothetical protein